MTLASIQSGSGVAAAAAFSQLQQANAGGSGAAAGASSTATSSTSSVIVSETSTVSPNGMITTVITYANGTTETVTSYGPAPASSQSIIA